LSVGLYIRVVLLHINIVFINSHCKIRESFPHPQSPFVGILSETYLSGKDKTGTAYLPAENTQKSLKKREKTSHRIQKKNTFVT
jgi:hypothetical protein